MSMAAAREHALTMSVHTVLLFCVFVGWSSLVVSKLESYLYLQLAVRSLASGEQLVSLLKRLVQVVDMREPVSKHHVYHKALMYDIGVGDCWIVSL